MEPFRLAREVIGNRTFLGYLMTMVFAFGCLFSYVSASPFVVQDVLGLSSGHYALDFAVNSLGLIGGGVLLLVLLACLVTLPLTLSANSLWYFDAQRPDLVRLAPAAKPIAMWWGMDNLGRSILARSLFGGTISLAIGICAAALSVFLGVTVGLLAGYRGGWVDSILMRIVDILYGLPYILLVILTKIAFEQPLTALLRYPQLANFVVLVFAIGAVSWLTMARVIRGQVLSLR